MHLEDYSLRKLDRSDLCMVLEWRNSERVRENMYSDQFITWEQHETWFSRIEHDCSSDYLIFQIKERPVGLINFTDIDRRNHKCFWGFYLGRIDLPKGTGRIMGFLGLEHIFKQELVRKVCGEVLAFNESSIAFHQRLGFKQEGRFKKHIWKNEQYVDVLSFALFKEDWQVHKTQLVNQFVP